MNIGEVQSMFMHIGIVTVIILCVVGLVAVLIKVRDGIF